MDDSWYTIDESDEWEDLPFMEPEKFKGSLNDYKPNTSVEKFLEHKGVKHLRELIEASRL